LRLRENRAVDTRLTVQTRKRLARSMEETGERHSLTYALRRRETLERPSRAPKNAFHPDVGDCYDAVSVQQAEAFDHRGEQNECRAIEAIPCGLRCQSGVDAESRTLQDPVAPDQGLSMTPSIPPIS
jgi:hypothetical protein